MTDRQIPMRDDPTWKEPSDEPEVVAGPSMDVSTTDAIRAIEALREHGNVGVTRNLAAAAAIDALKSNLEHGHFGRVCTKILRISPSYRARLLKLHKIREHVSDAQDWAATEKHHLSECQSAQNLIKLVHDWLKRDEPPKPKAVSKRQWSRPARKDATDSDFAGHAGADVAEQRDEISDLRARLAQCELDFIALRDPLPKEARERAFVALTSRRDREFVTIAKRFHWRESDLRREIETCPKV